MIEYDVLEKAYDDEYWAHKKQIFGDDVPEEIDDEQDPSELFQEE